MSAFQARVLATQLTLEARVPAEPEGPVFFDRGLLDGLAYCAHFGVAEPPGLRAAATAARYDRVLVLETPAQFELRGDTGRTSDRATSVALARAIERVYRDHGYEPIAVPAHPVAERVDAVLAALAAS